MNILLIAIIAMLVLGLLFGAVLAVASRVFTVEADPRTEEVYATLPQTNCGACGYGGCMAYAQTVVKGGEKTNLSARY